MLIRQKPIIAKTTTQYYLFANAKMCVHVIPIRFIISINLLHCIFGCSIVYTLCTHNYKNKRQIFIQRQMCMI